MIYIEDYISGLEFVEDAVDNKAKFTYSEVMSITLSRDYNEVIQYLNDLVRYRGFKKLKFGDVTIYSNIKKKDFKGILDSEIDLETIERSWRTGLIDIDDPQENAHCEALKSHIKSLKNQTEDNYETYQLR